MRHKNNLLSITSIKKMKSSISHQRQQRGDLLSLIDMLYPDGRFKVIKDLIHENDGGEKICRLLKERIDSIDYLGPNDKSRGHSTWNHIGHLYRINNRWNDAKNIYLNEYEELCKSQIEHNERIHKGTPLCWLFDCCLKLNQPFLAKRFIMLTLCEDAISGKGIIHPDKTGVYFRLNWIMGMKDGDIHKYSQLLWSKYLNDQHDGLFPENLLGLIDQDWIIEYPSQNELHEYLPNRTYLKYLVDQLPEKTGVFLERIAQYLIACIPGIRVIRGVHTDTYVYDIVCSTHGDFFDFRSEIQRYFICECKDWNKPASSEIIAKLGSYLENIKTNFGILFSQKGITGRGMKRAAEKVISDQYQNSGRIIIVIDKNDIDNIIRGENLIVNIRNKFEHVRLVI